MNVTQRNKAMITEFGYKIQPQRSRQIVRPRSKQNTVGYVKKDFEHKEALYAHAEDRLVKKLVWFPKVKVFLFGLLKL